MFKKYIFQFNFTRDKGFNVIKGILIFALTIGVYRGRIGSDDYHTFITSFNFFISGNLGDLINSYEWKNRSIWVILDLGIISITNIIVHNEYLKDVSSFLCGYQTTVFAFIGYFIIIKYFNKKLTIQNSHLAAILSIFCTPLITLATGEGIESLTMVLLLLMTLSNSKYKYIYGYFVFFIKYYQAGLSLTLLWIHREYRKLIIIFIIMVSTLIINFDIIKIFNRLVFGDGALNLYDQASSNPFNYSLLLNTKYLYNLYNSIFSPGAGLIWIWTLYLYVAYLGRDKYTYIKVFNIFLILMFLSLFAFWHGQGAGSRYITPLMVIFIPEVARGVGKIKILKYFILFYALINLTTIDYRNVSIYEYRNDSSKTGVPYGASGALVDVDFYDFSNYQFHPTVFSSTIAIYKLMKWDCKKSYVEVDCNQVYPRMLVSRINYSIDRGLKYTDGIKGKYVMLIFNYLPTLFYCFFIALIFCKQNFLFKKDN